MQEDGGAFEPEALVGGAGDGGQGRQEVEGVVGEVVGEELGVEEGGLEVFDGAVVWGHVGGL